MSDAGFFSRWSKRKEAVREGKAVEAEPAPAPLPQPSPASGAGSQDIPSSLRAEGRAGGQALPPPPTLEDVQSLTPESDFTRFVAPDVPPDVKNAAVKKLFADPHFNVMDGLDTYIDDYSKPDPIPPAMLKKLASARFLRLFEDEDEKKGTGEGREVADDPQPQTVAQSARCEPAVPPPTQDADPDLRLQQDHAPGPPGPGQGAG